MTLQIKMLAHLLKYDSAQGRYALADKVEATEDSIIVDGKEIKIYAKANAAELPWGELNVDVVLECTGFYTSKANHRLTLMLVQRKLLFLLLLVMICQQSFTQLMKTLTKDDTIISAASCTTNCLAPMANALNNFAKITKDS